LTAHRDSAGNRCTQGFPRTDRRITQTPQQPLLRAVPAVDRMVVEAAGRGRTAIRYSLALIDQDIN